MDASKEIAEITEKMAVFTAIATLGDSWRDYSPDEIDERAQEIGYRVREVMDLRERERNRYA